MNFDLQFLLPFIPVLLLALTLHEFAHAWTALQFGDSTAKWAGRVTLNPLKHLDPLGTLFMFVAHFGWAKPVPVNAANFTHRRAGLWVSLAGIVANLLQAVLYAVAWHALLHFMPTALLGRSFIAMLLLIGVTVNLSLALFNLLPLFPLDGAHIVENLLPRRQAYRFSLLSQQYGALILLALLMLGYVSTPGPLSLLIGVPRTWLTHLLLNNFY
jgi:Zn-dependent protease